MPNQRKIQQAFILGAGLGTRLQPLTHLRPKPLIPFFDEPLIMHSIRKCQALGIRDIIINTHHLAHQWEEVFPTGQWEDCRIRFSYEATLMDSGGGLKQIESMIDLSQDLLVLNGDIVTDFPLEKLIESHLAEENAEVSLALRNVDGKQNVGFDPTSGLVTDMRHLLGIDSGSWQFASAYCLRSEFFSRLPKNEVISVVPAFIELIRAGKLYGVEVNEGHWVDLGTPDSYIDAHLLYAQDNEEPSSLCDLPESSQISECFIGEGASVGEYCYLSQCILWPGVQIPACTIAHRQIFTS